MDDSFPESEAFLSAELDCISSHVSVTSIKLVPAALSAHLSSSVFQIGSTSGPRWRRKNPSADIFAIS